MVIEFASRSTTTTPAGFSHTSKNWLSIPNKQKPLKEGVASPREHLLLHALSQLTDLWWRGQEPACRRRRPGGREGCTCTARRKGRGWSAGPLPHRWAGRDERSAAPASAPAGSGRAGSDSCQGPKRTAETSGWRHYSKNKGSEQWRGHRINRGELVKIIKGMQLSKEIEAWTNLRRQSRFSQTYLILNTVLQRAFQH